MNYIDLCTGLSACTVAWKPLGWVAKAYAEIEKFPSRVLAHHYADVPNVGDFTKIKGDEYGAVDLVGTRLRLGMGVRRLTPRECERLQGFPDDYTRVPGMKSWRALDETEDVDELRAAGMKVRFRKEAWKVSKKTGVKRHAPAQWQVCDPDGPRYKALGNSMAVPVMRWIGERTEMVESLF